MTLTNSIADLDFGILAYPVITMLDTYTHHGSQQNLLGPNATEELKYNTSAENLVSATTPPTFLFHTANDGTVPVQDTMMFSEAMVKFKRPVQSLILPDGSHGLGLAMADPVRSWTGELERFLKYSI